MSPIRKFAFAWVVSVTALSIAMLSASFIYLREQYVTDQSLVEGRIEAVAAERGFKLEEAQKAGYSNSEIANYLVKADRAEFDRAWWRIVLIVSAIYAVLVLGILASTLVRESKNEKSAS